MNKEFIPYEQALELKELGFDEPCFGYYDIKDNNLQLFSDNLQDASCNSDLKYDDFKHCTTPTYSQAFRWFREKYQIISEIRNWNGTSNQWYYMIHHNDELLPWRWIENTSYEETELACLKKLIEIVKQK
jgi:hypothetical protein